MMYMYLQDHKKDSIIKRWAVVVAAVWLVMAMLFVGAGHANAQAAKVGDTSADEQLLLVGPLSTCGGASKPDKDDSKWGKYFKKNYTNIRKLASTNSTICGQGQKSHTVDYHCWAKGKDGKTWTYLRDHTTNYEGWVRDDLLKDNGSHVHC